MYVCVCVCVSVCIKCVAFSVWDTWVLVSVVSWVGWVVGCVLSNYVCIADDRQLYSVITGLFSNSHERLPTTN